MTDCYIYGHPRTHRGRGKPDRALHSVTGLELATQVLAALRERSDLDTSALVTLCIGAGMGTATIIERL